jgi:hypothetical protein
VLDTRYAFSLCSLPILVSTSPPPTISLNCRSAPRSDVAHRSIEQSLQLLPGPSRSPFSLSAPLRATTSRLASPPLSPLRISLRFSAPRPLAHMTLDPSSMCWILDMLSLSSLYPYWFLRTIPGRSPQTAVALLDRTSCTAPSSRAFNSSPGLHARPSRSLRLSAPRPLGLPRLLYPL